MELVHSRKLLLGVLKGFSWVSDRVDFQSILTARVFLAVLSRLRWYRAPGLCVPRLLKANPH